MRILITEALGGDRWRSTVQRSDGSQFPIEHEGLEIPAFTDWAGLYDYLLTRPEYGEVNGLRSVNPVIEQCVTNFAVALSVLIQQETPTRSAAFATAKADLIAALPSGDRTRLGDAINAAIALHQYTP